jgi:5-formyltetrahydrofolate cyclo-ligase
LFSPESRGALRAELKRRRAALTIAMRTAADRAITGHVAAAPWLTAQRNIGLYVSRAPEVDTVRLRTLARRRQCRVYLPRIVDYRRCRLQFFRDTGAATALNRFRIGEPAPVAALSVRALWVVFLPLLGFDARGTRLGSGAGYYDRLLAFRQHGHAHRPLLVGLAFACQEVARIEAAACDVPLDAVVTEAGIRVFSWSKPA